MPFYTYDLVSLLFMLPGILLAAWAQAKVHGNFNKYSRVQSAKCISWAVAARRIFDSIGLPYASIKHVGEV